jgi:hypothetical protein
MQHNAERRAYWKKVIEDQAQSGLSQREFCKRHQLILSQFSYHYLTFKKQEQKNLAEMSDIVPIHLRPEPSTSTRGEIKVLLPNGLQMVLPYGDAHQFKNWLEVLRSC